MKFLKYIRFLGFGVFFMFLLIGGYFIFCPEKEGMKRQEIEESLADLYLKDLIDGRLDEFQLLNQDSFSLQNGKSVDNEEEWEDNGWYTRDGITYTPDYAKGRIDCVLEIPSIRLRRGVYTGTWEEIQYNLDIWMVTVARPDYEYGKTHYCIYGHNHTVQNLSFNRLKDVKQGDLFTLTSAAYGKDTYQVTEIFAEWREIVTENIVDNFELPEDECYIITCGRGENRYKDLVVKGKRIAHQSVEGLKDEARKDL